MPRSFDPHTMVVLPVLNVRSAARLLAELLHVASAEPNLPTSLAADRDELVEAHAALLDALAKRHLAINEETSVARGADERVDSAFGALSAWLGGFARLPGGSHRDEATALRQAIFPTGLQFTKLRFDEEWQESETRLKLIAESGYDARIEALGGKPFLDELRAAHKAYGEALGITARRQEKEAPPVREALVNAVELVRAYVLRVTANVRKNDPVSGALAERLLAPITQWKDKPSKGGSVSGEGHNSGGGETAAPKGAPLSPVEKPA